MPTEVYLFLPQPASPTHLREAYPYGPSSSIFHSDLAIEIEPSQLEQNQALAVVSGMARLVLDPLSPQTCTLVLLPNYNVMTDLSAVVGKTVLAFVYRNLKTYDPPPTMPAGDPAPWPETPLDNFRIEIANLEDPGIPVPNRADQLEQFLNGEIAVAVEAGMAILPASTTGGLNGWGRLGFEIVFIPSGLLGEHGWNRLKELIDPEATTRRLDPMSFYQRVKAASDPLSLVADPDHALFTITTQRSLVELRDEYDQPFIGTALIDNSGSTTPFDSTADNRGTFALPTSTAFTHVEVPSYVLTELPSGDEAEASASNSFTRPDHWAMQLLFLSQNPAPVDDEGWFVPNLPPLPRYTEKNKVTPIRDGKEVFVHYVDAFRTLTQPDHFVYLAGWWMDKTFELIEGDPLSTMAQLTRFADANGAQVRALLWKQSGGQNSAEVDDINFLPNGNGAAILDDYTHDCTTLVRTATHHQKFLIVYGSQGDAFAFCGGVDINSNRRDSEYHRAVAAYHDVHAKVEGPAVGDIHYNFAERWMSHLDSMILIPDNNDKFASSAGSTYVQVACTYPRVSTDPYPFAINGSTTPLAAFRRAIRKAKKFIYIEDQYLAPYPGGLPYDDSEDTVGVLRELRNALPNIDYLIMVIPNVTMVSWLDHFPGITWSGQIRNRRRNFIESLIEVAPDKVHVFYLARTTIDPSLGEGATEGDDPRSSGGALRPGEIYCHSKVWIVDDVAAKIGSANCNRRSYTHDSEMDIVMVDGALDNGARRVARNLRLELWAEHLGVPQGEKAILEDHKLALHYWLPDGRFASAHIRDYDHNDLMLEIGTSGWDSFVDPDGR